MSPKRAFMNFMFVWHRIGTFFVPLHWEHFLFPSEWFHANNKKKINNKASIKNFKRCLRLKRKLNLFLSDEWKIRLKILLWISCRRALKKVNKEQLIQKRIEIYYQRISCFGAFLLNLSLNRIIKVASKSVKLPMFIETVFESTFAKILLNLMK